MHPVQRRGLSPGRFLAMTPPSVQLCGFPICTWNATQIRAWILAQVESGEGAWVLPMNLDLVSRAVREPEYRELVSPATLITADGFPLVDASKRLKRGPAIDGRTTGSDMTLSLVSDPQVGPIGVIGGANPHKALENVGRTTWENDYVNSEMLAVDDATAKRLIEALRSRGIRLVFMALGVPKQDRLVRLMRPLAPELVFICVGASFDFLSGDVKRAPKFFQAIKCEWLWRLISEPKRLWRRYVVEGPAGLRALRDDVNRQNRESV